MKSTFFCVQPISIDSSNLLSLYTIEHKNSSLFELSCELPSWISQLKKLNNSVFYDIYSIKLPSVSIFKLKSSMPKNLQNLLDIDKTNYYLLYDINLSYFILCFEIFLDYSSLSSSEFNFS